MREAYYKSFTQANNIAAFHCSGIYPCVPSRLLNVPRPHSDGTLTTFEELEIEINRKREEIRSAVLGENTVVEKSGFVYTTKGTVLTAPIGLDAARKRVQEKQKQIEEKEINLTKRELRRTQRTSNRDKRLLCMKLQDGKCTL